MCLERRSTAQGAKELNYKPRIKDCSDPSKVARRRVSSAYNFFTPNSLSDHSIHFQEDAAAHRPGAETLRGLRASPFQVERPETYSTGKHNPNQNTAANSIFVFVQI